MHLHELVEQIPTFDTAPPRDQIKLFAWWVHTHGDKELFGPVDIRACFDKLHVQEPPALATYLTRMVGSDLLAEKGKYKLARPVRAEFDKKYGVHHSIVSVSKILTELPSQVPNVIEREFLNEALKCYRIEAYRSCIVMTWNLAYSHLLDWLLREPERLALFNASISKRNSKKAALVVAKYDDFEDLKEREVIDICNIAGFFNSSVYKILVGKLDRRNIAAHPSDVRIVQSQADDTITDLVNNVILALA
jgi:hypothetical protein